MNETFSYLSEAQLTKNSYPRTLGVEAVLSMEDDQDDITKLSKKIRNIAKERAKRQISADQASAATTVWGTLLNRELTKDERQKAAETGTPFKTDAAKEDRVDEQIESMVNNPDKFKNIQRTVREYDTKLLAETFSGDMGKMIVVILGGGTVDSKHYIDRLDQVVAEKGPKMAEEIKAIVAKIEQDVADKKKKDEEEKEKPKAEIVDIRVVKARKVWDEFFERRSRNGHPITAEQRRLAEKAIARGEEPSIRGGAIGDGIFEMFDEEKYTKPALRELALILQEAGVEKKATPKLIGAAEASLREALAKKIITREEYDQFRADINEKKAMMQQVRAENLNVPRTAEQASNNARAQELLSISQDNASRIADDADHDAFMIHRSQVLGDDGILGAMTLRGINDSEKLEQVNRRIASLQGIDDPAQFKQAYNALVSEVGRMEPDKREDNEAPTSLSDAEKKGEKKGVTINKALLQQGIEEGWIEPDLLRTEPRSVVDLAKWIMVTDDARIWGPNAIEGYPLFIIKDKGTRVIDPDTGLPAFQIREDGTRVPVFEEGRKPTVEFQSASLIIWLRNKMIELHNDNSTDPMSPLTQVAIRTLYSPVNILSMKYDKQRYFSDPNTGEIMDDLYNEVVLEAWLFGVRRNNDLAYRSVMNSDEKLFDAIAQLNAKNEHTNSTNAADYYSMADQYVRGYDDDGKERVRDTKVGDGILLANSIYRNIADIDRLMGSDGKENSHTGLVEGRVEGVLEKNNHMFQRKGWEDAIRIITGKGHWEKVESYGNLYFNNEDNNKEVYTIDPKTKQKSIIFDSTGKIDKAGFTKYMNFFVSPTSLQSNIRVAREIVKIGVANEMRFNNGLEYPPSEEEMKKDKQQAIDEKKNYSITARRNIKRVNLDFVEINSFVEQRWNGAAARSDTGYRGYDAWTKMNAQKYRERQSGKDTMGPIGNPYDIPILKNVAPDMWLALRTEGGEVAQEIYNKILRIQKDLYKETDPAKREQLQNERNAIMETLRFPDTTQQDWASNQVIRGAKIWHAMLGTEDLGFSKLVTRNAFGVLQYGRAEFEKVVKDEFLKNRRYAFKSNNAINYGAVDRVYTDLGHGRMGFKEMTVAESMFGHDVMSPLLEDWYDGKTFYSSFDGEKKIIIDGNAVYEDIGTRENPKRGRKIKDATSATINDYLNSDRGRNNLFKNVCRAGLAAQLKSHRQYFGTGERWNTEMVLKFVDSLKTLQTYKEDDHNPGREEETGETFFSDEDIKWILKTAGCPYWKLIRDEVGAASLDLGKAIPELLKVFFSGIVDFAA